MEYKGDHRKQTRLRVARYRQRKREALTARIELMRSLNPRAADSINVCVWCRRIAVLRPNRAGELICCVCG